MNAIPAPSPTTQPSHHQPTLLLVIGAIGVVFGDIGTSPLYALKTAFSPASGIPLTEANVFGILSLLVWSMIWVIAFKYLAVIMRADNSGEGGILALLALALRGTERAGRLKAVVIGLGIFGASMFYGDSVITPAISVLSAVEGLEIVTPRLAPYVLPIALAVLAGLFLIQRHGTARVGAFMGPVTSLWFIAIGAAGMVQIAQHPAILGAASPAYAVGFIEAYPLAGFLVLGAVFLVVTGGEALYADMGHFGKRAIRIGWFGLVMPALLLNYFGQAALVLREPEAIRSPFYLMFPPWALPPMVLLATCATVIAAQAVISGAFSITRQAILLGYIPRMEILHTSERAMGQIYIPFVNWLLFVAVVLLVLTFGSSERIAHAYGIAVSATMVIEVLLLAVVARRLWRWSPVAVGMMIGAMLAVDLTFFASNATKFASGGWFPILFGAAIFAMLVTWKRGRALLRQRLSDQSIPLGPFLQQLDAMPPGRVPGTAIFMSSATDAAPHALLHNLKHNKVLHERVVFLTITTHDVPRVPEIDRVQARCIFNGFYQVEAWYGFTEQPDIHEILEQCRARYGMEFELMDTSFFLSRESVIPLAPAPSLAFWRDHLFAWMTRNAARATDFFNIPANRVVELGTHIEI
jgi:KUP system potassium uptake protein